MIATITLVILIFSILLVFFLLTVRSENKLANRILAAYFIIFAAHISVFFYGEYLELPLVVEMLRDNLVELSGPLLFLYLLSNIYSDFKLRRIHLLHLLPFVIGILIYIPRFYTVSESERILFTESFSNQFEAKFSYLCGVWFSILYLVLMFVELKKYRQVLQENYADTTSFNYKWLFQLTMVVTLIFIFSQFKQLYRFYGSDVEILNIMRLLLTCVLLLFLCWIVLKSMYQPELFKAIDSKHVLVQEQLKESSQLNKTNAEVNKRIEKLRLFMEENEPYLDSSLTIQKLAALLGMPQRELSVLINHQLNQHFFNFITDYRIKKALSLISNPTYQNRTIQEIYYEVGFNSKSPFNKAFKDQTGMTPSEYRSKL